MDRDSSMRKAKSACVLVVSTSMMAFGPAARADEAPQPDPAVVESTKPGLVWQKELEVAQKLAGVQKKLVLDFFLLGNLNASDC